MDIWIGLAHVKPNSGNNLLEGAKGGIVPVLALANSVDGFASCVESVLTESEFLVVEIEDIELFKVRLSHSAVDKAIVELASKYY